MRLINANEQNKKLYNFVDFLGISMQALYEGSSGAYKEALEDLSFEVCKYLEHQGIQLNRVPLTAEYLDSNDHRDFLRGEQNKMKTFKEQLTEKANNKTYDISKHIEAIKVKMARHVDNREFVIDLFEIKDGACLTLGSGRGPIYQTYIPYGCKPEIYMKLFTVALKELGFQDKDITKSAGESKDFYTYSISVKW